MNHKQAQQLIRNLSPDYLAQNPPVGMVEVLADMTKRFTPVEFRKPFVRRPDGSDEQPECGACLGDGECWITEEQDYVECSSCSGTEWVPFRDNQIFIFVYRDFHSVEALVTVSPNGDCDAVVTVSGSGFEAGQKIELTEEEADLARRAVKEAS